MTTDPEKPFVKRSWFVRTSSMPLILGPWNFMGWLWTAFTIASILVFGFGTKMLVHSHPIAAWACGIFGVLLFIRNMRIAYEHTTRL
jgi:hypothetical protein